MSEATPMERVKIADLKDLVINCYNHYPNNIAFLQKDDNKVYQSKTFRDFKNDIAALGTGLLHLFDEKEPKIAVIGENSYEWMTTYLAVTGGNAIIVPLDNGLPENEIWNALQKVKVNAVVYADSKKEMIKNIEEKSDYPFKVIPITPEDGRELSLAAVQQLGQAMIDQGDTGYENIVIDPEKCSIIPFTSATSSTAKAVMLSHKNIASNINFVGQYLDLSPADRGLSVLPVHHTYECTVQLFFLSTGASVAINESMRTLEADMLATKPTVMNVVPLYIKHFRQKVLKNIDGILAQHSDSSTGPAAKTQAPFDPKTLTDENIRRQIMALFGGELRMLICGAAPLDKQNVEFFADLGLLMLQGYGLTEASPVLAVSHHAFYRPGFVGFVFADDPYVTLDIANPNESGEGELIAKSRSTMNGYYQDPESTAAVIKDGWLYTGDVAKFVPIAGYNFVQIVGRTKNVIISSNGKNTYPEELEELLERNDIVQECVVREDDDKITAVIVTNKELIQNLHLSGEQAKQFVADAVEKVNQSIPHYKRIKQIKYSDILPKTTTKKVQRHKVSILDAENQA
jgi:Long-chain acyl-CoA synthetases (AMP-forming)